MVYGWVLVVGDYKNSDRTAMDEDRSVMSSDKQGEKVPLCIDMPTGYHDITDCTLYLYILYSTYSTTEDSTSG